MQVIKATTDNKIYIIDLDANDVKAVIKEIGGFGCVRTQQLHDFFHEPVTMIFDYYGYVKGKPLNVIASAFYQGDIVGDVLFVPEEYGKFVDFYDVNAQCEYMKSLL